MNKKIVFALSSALLLGACNQPAQPAESSSSQPAESSSAQQSSATSSQESQAQSSAAQSSEAQPSEEASSEEQSVPAAKKVYNIIMTAATIPPVVSALNSIENGAETYAWIERGKTYSGIADSNFVNLGFDPANNGSSGITEAAYTSIIDKVKDLVAAEPEAHFNFYTTDYKPFAPVRVAGAASLDKDNFTVYMVEDGTATYSHAKTKFFDKYSTIEDANAHFETRKAQAYKIFEDGLANPQVIVDKKMHNCFTEGYYYTFPLATHPNFVHLMQNKTKLDSSTDKLPGSTFRKVYGLDTNDTDYPSNVIYRSISSRVHDLDENKKAEYLDLMFGQYRAESERLLNRTKRDNGEEAVPSKKFIFIGTRMRQSGLGYFDDVKFSDLTADYVSVPNRIREVLTTEADYRVVYNYLTDESNFEAAWKNKGASVIDAVRSGALKNYLDYAYNLKFTYRAYGDEYDILFKGHPAETFDQVEKWSYTVSVDGETIHYRNYMHALGLKFHSDDSEGKFVGILPGGVAAENLAYLGVDTYVGGLPSSTFTGYEPSAPILYVFGNTNNDILSDGAIEQRFLDGELSWNVDGKQIETQYMNKGNMARWQSAYFGGLQAKVAETDAALAEKYGAIKASYDTRFNAWADAVAGFALSDHDAVDIDATGALLFKNQDDLSSARSLRLTSLSNAFAGVDPSEYSQATYDLIVAEKEAAEEVINNQTRISLWERAIEDFKSFVANAPKAGEEVSESVVSE